MKDESMASGKKQEEKRVAPPAPEARGRAVASQ